MTQSGSLQHDVQLLKLWSLKPRNSSQGEIRFGIPANSLDRAKPGLPGLTWSVCLWLGHAFSIAQPLNRRLTMRCRSIAWTKDQKACLNRCISSADYARMLKIWGANINQEEDRFLIYERSLILILFKKKNTWFIYCYTKVFLNVIWLKAWPFTWNQATYPLLWFENRYDC